MKSKLTPIDWLLEEIPILKNVYFKKIIKRALDMQKEQKLQAFRKGKNIAEKKVDNPIILLTPTK
jgi:hypothetical protein